MVIYHEGIRHIRYSSFGYYFKHFHFAAQHFILCPALHWYHSHHTNGFCGIKHTDTRDLNSMFASYLLHILIWMWFSQFIFDFFFSTTVARSINLSLTLFLCHSFTLYRSNDFFSPCFMTKRVRLLQLINKKSEPNHANPKWYEQIWK